LYESKRPSVFQRQSIVNTEDHAEGRRKIQMPLAYSSLEPGQIRILTLLPGTDAGIIRCSLSQESVEEAASTYIALSYTWGPVPDKYLEIIIDETSQQVRPNLYQALISLRDQTKTERYWIDALCINQEDIPEKNMQIPMMDQIYSKASFVLAWLGESKDDSDFVIDCIYSEDSKSYQSARFINGYAHLTLRDWFSRTWILQEFCLNKAEPLFAVGNNPRISWKQLFDAFPKEIKTDDIHYNRQIDLKITTTFSLKSHLPLLQNLRHTILDKDGNYKGCNLYLALSCGLGQAVTDPRDKIYGVHSLMVAGDRDAINVDYSKDADELFLEIMTKSLIHIRNPLFYTLTFPLYPRHTQGQSAVDALGPTQLPSWVVDFNPSLPQKQHMKCLLFNTTLLGSDRAVKPYLIDDQKLYVTGVSLGLVSDLVVATYDPNTELEAMTSYSNPNGLEASLDREIWLKESYVRTRTMVQFLIDVLSAFVKRIENIAIVEPLWKTLLLAQHSSARFSDTDKTSHDFDSLLGLAKDFLESAPMDQIESHYDSLCAVKQKISDFLAENGASFASPNQELTTLINRMRTETSLLDQTGSITSSATYAHIKHTFTVGSKAIPLLPTLNNGLNEGRCFFICEKDFYGVSNPGTQEGDELVLLFPNMYIPFILRRTGECREMIAVAYLPPALRQKAIELAEKNMKKFTIV
jgi:hypothetical protein